jgi:hypothetical protein
MVTTQSDFKKTANPLSAVATKTRLGRTYLLGEHFAFGIPKTETDYHRKRTNVDSNEICLNA